MNISNSYNENENNSLFNKEIDNSFNQNKNNLKIREDNKTRIDLSY